MKNHLIKAAAIVPRAISVIARRYEIMRARNLGMTVGENTRFVGSSQFGSEPFLISIGRDCLITDGVTFITHDGGIQVPFIRDGLPSLDVYGRKSTFKSITIGDNCFIGIGAILLPGTEVGDNSIIGAGSIVRGKFEPGAVIAGNPARQVSTVEEYFAKNAEHVIEFTGSESADARRRIIQHHVSS